MRTSAPNGFDFWEAMDGIREAVSSAVIRREEPGDIRAEILAVLGDEPMNGYQVIRAIEARTDGAWAPSAGMVYPTLQLLVDEGLVAAAQAGERKVYSLTPEGREVAAETSASGSPDAEPGASGRERFERNLALPKAGMKLAQAAGQVAQNGTPEQSERAVAIIDEARRKLYAILAEG